MKKKQTLAMLLAAAMVLSMPVGAYAEELLPGQGQEIELSSGAGTPDYESPKLLQVRVNETSVEVGGEVVIAITATDDVSGVDYVQFEFSNSATGTTMDFSTSIPEDQVIVNDTFEFKFSIPLNQEVGQFELTRVILKDKAERYSWYGGDDLPIPNKIVLNVANAGDEDLKKPELLDVSISDSTVSASEKLTLYLEVSDDVSGVDYVQAVFVNDKNGREISASKSFYDEPLISGTVNLDINIKNLEEAGTFHLDRVALSDSHGRYAYYYTRQNGNFHDLFLPKEISFTVTNESSGDVTAPVLSKISIDGNITEVEAPKVLNLTVVANDDYSEIDYIQAHFVNKVTGREIDTRKLKDDPCELVLEVTPYEPSGLFELEYVYLVDSMDNFVYYRNEADEDGLQLPNELSFYVKNTDESSEEGDIFTSTLNTNLSEDIKNMEDGKTAYISYGRNDVLPAEVFEAIKGTNKTIVLESAGIQWIFNGQSITDKNIKEINLNTTIEEKYSFDSEASEELPWEQKAIILSFEDNGPLPGPAKIRVKMDYAFQNYVGAENLYVYYYDNTNKKFELVGEKLTITDDEYLEFTITHNSDFVITSGPIETQEGENPDNPNLPVNPGEDDKPVNPSNPSNPTTPSRPNSSTTTAPGTPINYESEKPDPADEQAVEAYNFWQNTKREIRIYERAGSLRVYVPADVTYMPASVMETLRVENVPVVLQWQGHRIEIPAGKAQPKQPLKAYWPMKTLCELYNA